MKCTAPKPGHRDHKVSKNPDGAPGRTRETDPGHCTSAAGVVEKPHCSLRRRICVGVLVLGAVVFDPLDANEVAPRFDAPCDLPSGLLVLRIVVGCLVAVLLCQLLPRNKGIRPCSCIERDPLETHSK